MDNRLMPPSCFGPDNEDSLESSPAVQPALPGSLFLRRPEDFGTCTGGIQQDASITPFINIGRVKNANDFSVPGGYQTPPQIARNHGFSGIQSTPPRNPPTDFSDLIRLQAENDALKALIQARKAELNAQPQELPKAVKDYSSTRQAVIEHQTQHIARLQRDIDEQKLLLNEKNTELCRLEKSVSEKKRENHQLVGSVESLESQLGKRNDEARTKDQEVENLQKDISVLRKEKDELMESHSASLRVLEESHAVERADEAKLVESTLEELKLKHNSEISDWTKQLETVELRHKAEIETISKKSAEEKERMENEFDEKSAAFEKEITKRDEEIIKEKEKSETILKSLEQEKANVDSLQMKLNEVQLSLESSEEANKVHLNRINQLQAYIGQQQADDYERSQWKVEKKQYEENIVALQVDKETMVKTFELQNIRLQSISKILETQEEAIHANAKAFSTGNIRGGPAHVITKRWREKVFELMIHCKYGELSMKSLEDKHTLIESDLKEQLEEEKWVSVILENQLTECKAQLEMQQGENERQNMKIQKLTQNLDASTKNSSQLEEAIVTMSEQVAASTSSLCSDFQERFTKLAEKTVHLEQRLVFANNRLRTLQDLFVRRENLWKAKLKREKDQKVSGFEQNPIPDKDIATKIRRPDLEAEIDLLTKERDALSHKLSSDSAAFENSTAQFKEREAALERELEVLQKEIQDKCEEAVELKIHIEKTEEKLEDKERQATDAVENAKLIQMSQEKVLEERLSEAQGNWEAERLELEKKLEGSQREHARTVVTSRQSERNAIREKKRASENMEAVMDEHRKEKEKLLTKLNAAKRDNNLLMTTLRQQGLISTFKEARAAAKRIESDKSSPKKSPTKSKSLREVEKCLDEGAASPPRPCVSDFNIDSASVPTESLIPQRSNDMAEMLKDLVIMTENILDD